MSVRVMVNGNWETILSAPASRLSTVLRDELGLTGTKIGCEAGDCGACTVLLEGAAVCACITPLAHCVGKAVESIEGLALAHAHGESLNALQQAFLEAGATQCGFCTPGMLMAATGLLQSHRLAGTQPTRDDVLHALGGVLCRCTGYQSIVDAVLAVANITQLTPHVLDENLGVNTPVVGTRLARVEGSEKLRGLTLFGADAAPADCLGVRVIRSPYPRASFSISALATWVNEQAGTLSLVSAQDVPCNAFAIFPELRDQPVFAAKETRFRGEAVAALIGQESVLTAIDVASLPLHWQSLPAALDVQSALEAPQPIHEFRPDNVLCRGRVCKGQKPSASEMPDLLRVDVTARTHHVEHAYLEPEAGYVLLEGEGDTARLQVVACTQTPYLDRDELANVLQWNPERIRIRPSAIGGGFGGKLDLSIQPILAVAALALSQRAGAHAGRALRLVYERSESMQSSTKRHPASMQASLMSDSDGVLRSYEFSGDFDTGAYASWGPTVANRVPIHASGPYRLPHVVAQTRAVYTNNAIAGAFRGFGVPQSTLLIEAALDQLARELGLDRLELRLANALRAGDATATGQVLHASVGLQDCLNALRPVWRLWEAQVQEFNLQAKASGSALRRGRGIAAMWYGIGNTVMANPSRMRIEFTGKGRYLLRNGAQEIGQGSSTVMAQIAAQTLGVSPDQIDQTSADTDLTADAGKSSASRQTFVSGRAVQLAAEDLLEKLRQWRAKHDEAEPPLGIFGEGMFDPPTVALDADGQGVPYACYGFAAQTALVEVDLELGRVRVLNMEAAHDVGKAINPTLVEGQIHGGIAQGLGLALMEEYVSGKTDNLHDYLIPAVGDMPRITCHLIEDPEPLGPFGAKGVGEPALVATAPAILSAIEDACGLRPTVLPVTPSRLWSLLQTRTENQ